MKQYLFQIIICTCFISTISCQDKKSTYALKAIQFNDKAIEYIKVQNFDSALFYLDKAIENDRTYYIPHGNKSKIYCSLKEFNKALLETQKEIDLKPDLAEAWTFAGMLYDKLGDTLNASKYYSKSVEIFDERISNPAKQKYIFANKLNRAISLILMGQEEKGQIELKKLKESNPNDISIENFLNFNKKEYLNQIFKD